MEVTFYSTHCPRCKILETKLKQKNIQYTEVNDVDEMLKLGLKSAPALKVGDELFDFMGAINWIKTQEAAN